MNRYILALFLAFGTSLVIGPWLIPVLKRLKFGQHVRSDGPKTHLIKEGTPTMGGIMILCSMLVPLVLIDFKNSLYCIFAVFATLAFGIIGFLDDYIKIYKKRSLGLRAYQKFTGQFGFSLIIAIFARKYVGTSIIVPFAGTEWDLGAFYIPFAVFVILSIVNSVNLTDGLDGLASSVVMICMTTFTIIGFAMLNNAYFLNIGELPLFTAALTGATLGFLVFNTYPARVIMGDTGALALGGALSVVALLTRLPLLIPIMGLMLVASSVSVILQVGSYKLRKKRIFRMAPLHHHFEEGGVPETKVVAMYIMITILCSLISLVSLT
ncbi:MAG TPA: phospho-N-acetylmuramoyl-pentapeptide-transferase [Clostridia bacterium]|nr:phospho-N-acetylmuramoyl-pentapeptide-transferase [Clostridia bacterium]